MMQNVTKIFLATVVALFLTVGCTPSPDALKKVLSDHPDILMEVIKKNPEQFFETLQKAQQEAQVKMREKAELEEKQRMDDEFKNPKTPEVEDSRAVLGDPKAPILIVEYSDFQCPYCKRGFDTVKQVKEKYGDKVRLVFKHLPLDFHPLAMPAAQRFEAIAMQDSKKAYKFHDLLFEGQGGLRDGGEKFLDQLATKAGADLAKMKKDMVSETVREQIEKDIAEAKKFGISGTPGFVVAGITLKGAYPLNSFTEIIDKRLKEKGN